MEAVVSRMKTIQAAMNRLPGDSGHVSQRLRFVAVSATIPNISDVGYLKLVMKSCFIYRITFNSCKPFISYTNILSMKYIVNFF